MQIPQQYLPAGVVTEKESIIGQYAAVDLLANDYLTGDKLSADALLTEQAQINLMAAEATS